MTSLSGLGTRRRARRLPIVPLLSWLFILVAIGLLMLELIRFSQQSERFSTEVVVAGVPVGGLSTVDAANRIEQAYAQPVTIWYADSPIQLDPASIGFRTNREAMLAEARTGGNSDAAFWQRFLNYLAGSESQTQVSVNLVADYQEALLRQIVNDIAAANDRESLLTAVRARFDRLDTLVNNAGIAPRTRLDLLETTPQSFDEVMNTNLRGPFLLTQAVARWMIAQPRLADLPQPSVINIGSISAYTVSLMRGEYCMAKAALGMMTALFAARLAEHGIGVYEVRPGIIQTDMTTATLAAYERMIADGLLPVRRVGQPEDVARAVGMLASGELPYSSGEVINVDGGFHLRRL